jgi:hypothetical protein
MPVSSMRRKRERDACANVFSADKTVPPIGGRDRATHPGFRPVGLEIVESTPVLKTTLRAAYRNSGIIRVHPDDIMATD